MSETPTLPSLARGPAAPAAGDAANALPAGHRLHEFELRGVVGVGGFGIVYRAFDHTLERDVAIKEYMPSTLAGRSGKQQVSLLSASHAQTFAIGLSSFVNEAKLLARFDHPSLFKVHRFWEDNGTAYMVMPLYRGSTLRQLRQNTDAAPAQAWLMRLLEQLFGALEVMHREGVFHRDIAPDNILVADGAPAVLLDFGAARRVITDRSQSLTAILKPSYAPLEQYAESTGMRQGPWTDFYALGATLHFTLTGKPPMPATARAITDEQPRLAGSGQGGVSDVMLQVCDWMLAPRPQDRPQNVAELRAALAGRLPVPQRAKPVAANAWQATQVQGDAAEHGTSTFGPSQWPIPQAQASRRRNSRLIWLAAAAMVAMAGSGAWWAHYDSTRQREQAASSQASLAATWPINAAPAVTNSSASQPIVANAAAAPVQAAPLDSATLPKPSPGAPTVVAPALAAPRLGPQATAAAPKLQLGSTRSGEPRLGTAKPARAKTEPVAAPPVAAPPAADASAAPGPVAVAAAPRNPRDQCGHRHLLALHRCLVRECAKPEFEAHRECQRVRDIEAHARNLGDM